MSWLGASVGVSAGLSYLSSRDQADAARDAAKYQTEGMDAATKAQMEMYYQGREDQAPWREAGGRDLANLERVEGMYEAAIMDPGQYKESPGYNWLQKQGEAAIGRKSAAQGQFGSGRHDKDLMQYGQGLALQDYQGYLGRLGSLMDRYAGTSGVGQTSANQSALLGANTANQVGSYNIYGGQAQGGMAINQGNARTGLYGNLSSIFSNSVNQGITGNYLGNMGNSQGYSSGPGYSAGPRNVGQSGGYQ
jgi:hypothetical protein